MHMLRLFGGAAVITLLAWPAAAHNCCPQHPCKPRPAKSVSAKPVPKPAPRPAANTVAAAAPATNYYGPVYNAPVNNHYYGVNPPGAATTTPSAMSPLPVIRQGNLVTETEIAAIYGSNWSSSAVPVFSREAVISKCYLPYQWRARLMTSEQLQSEYAEAQAEADKVMANYARLTPTEVATVQGVWNEGSYNLACQIVATFGL